MTVNTAADQYRTREVRLADRKTFNLNPMMSQITATDTNTQR